MALLILLGVILIAALVAVWLSGAQRMAADGVKLPDVPSVRFRAELLT